MVFRHTFLRGDLMVAPILASSTHSNSKMKQHPKEEYCPGCSEVVQNAVYHSPPLCNNKRKSIVKQFLKNESLSLLAIAALFVAIVSNYIAQGTFVTYTQVLLTAAIACQVFVFVLKYRVNKKQEV